MNICLGRCLLGLTVREVTGGERRQFGVLTNLLVADKQHQGIITSDSKIILRLLFEDDLTQASIQESKD